MVRVDQQRRTLPWIALGVVYVLWGSTYLANRYIIVSMPPLLASGFRFMTGGLLLGLLVLVFAGRRVFAMTRAQLGTAALSGLLLPAWGNGLVILAQSQVASGLTALLIASVPLYIAVLRALTGDRPRRATVLGVLVGAAGLALLVLVGPSGGSGGVSGSAWWGPPLVLLAGAGWATGTFAATRLAVPANPFALATVQQLIGGAILVVVGTTFGERLHLADIAPVSWWAWLYMSLFVSLGAFSAYAYALATLPVSTVATYAYVNPVIAVLLGVVVAGERFSVLQLAGGAIVLVAVVMVIAAERPPDSPGTGPARQPDPTDPAAGILRGPLREPPADPLPENVGGGWQHRRRGHRGSPGHLAVGDIAVGNAVDVIGPAAARRAALAAQGFADARPPGPPTRRHLARLLARIRLLQLDSVNVAVRAHYMPVFSRLGPYDPGLVDDAAWTHSARRPRMLVEYWAHEASLLPVADWPLLLSGAKRAGWWRHYEALADREPGLVDELLAAVKELGPVGAGTLETALGAGAARPKGASWWARSDVKRICEYLFGTGALTTGARVHFQRLYDLPERVLPPEVLAAHPADPEASARALVLQRGRRARCRDGAGPARLLPPRARAVAAGRRRAGRGRRAGAGRRPRAGAIRRTGCPARGSRGGSRRGRCCRRSTR